MVGLLPYWHHRIILKHLRRYHCNTELYDTIKDIKDKTSGTEAIRVETSIKDGRDKRYVIPILFSEFQRYSRTDQDRLLFTVHISRADYTPFLAKHRNKIGTGTDIIFGMDGTKGKIYLDFNQNEVELVCLESTGKVKTYTEILEQTETISPNYPIKHTLKVESGGNITGYHYFLKTPQRIRDVADPVYWIGEELNRRTGTKPCYYTRPNLPLVTLRDFITMSSLSK